MCVIGVVCSTTNDLCPKRELLILGMKHIMWHFHDCSILMLNHSMVAPKTSTAYQIQSKVSFSNIEILKSKLARKQPCSCRYLFNY